MNILSSPLLVILTSLILSELPTMALNAPIGAVSPAIANPTLEPLTLVSQYQTYNIQFGHFNHFSPLWSDMDAAKAIPIKPFAEIVHSVAMNLQQD